MSAALSSEYVAIVPIRAGSKGLAGKNVRPFAGLPLFEHAVRQGLRCCAACIVSTDIEEVLSAPPGDERILHRRPADLAGDDTPMGDVLAEVIRARALQDHTIVLLQATSPLRRDATVREAMALHATGAHDLVMSVTEAERSVLKWGLLDGESFVPINEPGHCFANRQSLPPVYRPNGAVYVFSGAWLLANGGLATQRIGAVVTPAEQSLDIDDEEDFRAAEQVFARLSGKERTL